jgi:hypothetical protein
VWRLQEKTDVWNAVSWVVVNFRVGRGAQGFSHGSWWQQQNRGINTANFALPGCVAPARAMR